MNKTQQLVDLICSKVTQHPEKVKVSKSPATNVYVVKYDNIPCLIHYYYEAESNINAVVIENLILLTEEQDKLFKSFLPFIKDFLSQEKDDKLDEMITMWGVNYG